MTTGAEAKVGLTILQRVLVFAAKHFSAFQLCWLCIAVTLSLALFFAMNYATAAEVATVRSDLSSVRVAQLEQDMIDTRKNQCEQEAGRRSWYGRRIEELQRQYRVLNQGKDYPVPECGEL